MDFPITPEFWWSTDILSSSIFLQGVDQKILPCGQGRIDRVKINPSLLMMRECNIIQFSSSISVKSLPGHLLFLNTEAKNPGQDAILGDFVSGSSELMYCVLL